MSRFAKALEGGAENLTLAIADWMFNESLSADEGKLFGRFRDFDLL